MDCEKSCFWLIFGIWLIMGLYAPDSLSYDYKPIVPTIRTGIRGYACFTVFGGFGCF